MPSARAHSGKLRTRTIRWHWSAAGEFEAPSPARRVRYPPERWREDGSAAIATRAPWRHAIRTPQDRRAPSSDLTFALRTLAIPKHGTYIGAYIDWGDKEDTVTLEAIEAFEQIVGKHQAIVASSSYWGEQTFPEDNVRLITNHGSVPLIFWSPWDKPYIEGRGPDKFSLTSIIAGEHDAYIDMWAEKARAFGGADHRLLCQ